MKFMILVLLLTSAFVAKAALPMSSQVEIVESLAKEKRRQLHIRGYQDVSSAVQSVDFERLSAMMKEDSVTEQPLNRAEISSLYSCLRSRRQCSLFSIHIDSNYMSGFGTDRIWVMLDPQSGRYQTIEQSVYSE